MTNAQFQIDQGLADLQTKIDAPVNLPDGLRLSLESRQEDTGWGRACAHFIPFYGLYYACSRRTITPFAYAFAGNLVTSFVIGFCVALSYPQVTEKQLDGFGSLSLLAMPVWVKFGINSSRKQGAKKLQEARSGVN